MNNEQITNQTPAEASPQGTKLNKLGAAAAVGALIAAGPLVSYDKAHDGALDITTTSTEFSAPQVPGLPNVEAVAPVEEAAEKPAKVQPSPTDTTINVGGESGAIKFGKPEGEVKPGTHDPVSQVPSGPNEVGIIDAVKVGKDEDNLESDNQKSSGKIIIDNPEMPVLPPEGTELRPSNIIDDSHLDGGATATAEPTEDIPSPEQPAQ